MLGMDAHKESVAVHRRLGNLPGEVSLYPNLTGAQVLEYSAHLRGGVPQEEIARLASRLDADLTRPMKAYSHGNKQKIGLIQAMMHKPELLILDEPTTGLDPLVQQALYELLEEVRGEGRTVFFSSHVLPEVERLCDRIAIVRDGRLAAVETVAALKQKAVRRIEVTFSSPVPAEPFAALPGVVDVQAAGQTLFVTAAGEMDALVKAIALYKVINLATREPTLEEIFLTFYQGDGNRAE
jgi:ABC-2 type transport system ATP-binding protein